jgi:hypothetical protein
MENEEKNILADSGEGIVGRSKDLSDMEKQTDMAADKYEDFAGQGVNGRPPSFSPDEEEEKSENDFLVERKRGVDLKALLTDKKNVAFIALVIIVAVGAFYFLNKKEDPAPSVEVTSPIINATMQAMQKVQSYSYDGTMSFGRTLKSGGNDYSMDYQIIYKGVVEKGAGGDASVYSSLVYDTVRNAGDNQKETSIGLESVTIGGNKYLKLDNILIAGTDRASKAAILENNLKGFIDNWYSVSDADYKSLYTEVQDYAFLPNNLNILDVESVGKFDEAFNHNLLTSPQNMGDEPIGEIETIHYRVGLNTQGGIEFVSVLAANNANDKTSDETMKILQELQNNAQEADKFKKMMDYVMQNVGIEIWVGKNDNLIHRFRIKGSFDGDAIQGFYDKLEEVYGGSFIKEGGTEDGGVKFDIDYTLSGFDSAKVREPEGAKDFAEIANKLQGVGADTAVSADSSSTVDTDADGLTDEQEKVYGSDVNNPDTDGDGYKDGAEVKAGYDPIMAGSARLDYSKLKKKE